MVTTTLPRLRSVSTRACACWISESGYVLSITGVRTPVSTMTISRSRSFADGLDVWSRGDGTPGSPTYEGPGAFVSADADFGGALETVKTDVVQRLRYMGETTILPGCYLRVTARVKAVAGALPAVRIAGYAGTASGALGGVSLSGPATQLTSYGEVVEVSAIIGTGNRNGVDLVWNGALYGHLGLDLTGSSGGLVRIDDIEIEDISSVFLRDVVGMVDVRDYGAIGDGVTDDSAAFEAADQAADGENGFVIPAGAAIRSRFD